MNTAAKSESRTEFRFPVLQGQAWSGCDDKCFFIPIWKQPTPVSGILFGLFAQYPQISSSVLNVSTLYAADTSKRHTTTAAGCIDLYSVYIKKYIPLFEIPQIQIVEREIAARVARLLWRSGAFKTGYGVCTITHRFAESKGNNPSCGDMVIGVRPIRTQ